MLTALSSLRVPPASPTPGAARDRPSASQGTPWPPQQDHRHDPARSLRGPVLHGQVWHRPRRAVRHGEVLRSRGRRSVPGAHACARAHVQAHGQAHARGDRQAHGQAHARGDRQAHGQAHALAHARAHVSGERLVEAALRGRQDSGRDQYGPARRLRRHRGRGVVHVPRRRLESGFVRDALLPRGSVHGSRSQWPVPVSLRRCLRRRLRGYVASARASGAYVGTAF